jgi:MYXO-CTERM domain-containing protein
MERVLAVLRGDAGTEGGAYLTKTMLAAAVFVARGGDPSVRPLVEEALVRMARDIITEDTQVMGEVFITLRDADGGVTGRENRVSIPHLWEATLFYLTTMALSEPMRFDFDRRAMPAAMTPPPGTVPLPVPVADAGMVAMDAAVVADAGAAMDAAVTAPPADDGCGCAVPGRSGSARGWMGASLLGLWAMTRRRRSRA